jgi:hypothetical protein
MLSYQKVLPNIFSWQHAASTPIPLQHEARTDQPISQPPTISASAAAADGSKQQRCQLSLLHACMLDILQPGANKDLCSPEAVG